MGNADNFCFQTSNIWRTVGYFLFIFKIVIPIILIILGMVDLGKAVISSDDKAISKAAKSLMMRVIAAVAIFFVPTIVSFVIQLVGGAQGDYDTCAACLSSPSGPVCTDAYNKSQGLTAE